MRAYANRWGVTVGERVAVFTNNDDGLRSATDLQAKGVDVVAVIDSRTGGALLIPASGICKARKSLTQKAALA